MCRRSSSLLRARQPSMRGRRETYSKVSMLERPGIRYRERLRTSCSLALTRKAHCSAESDPLPDYSEVVTEEPRGSLQAPDYRARPYLLGRWRSIHVTPTLSTQQD